MPTAFCESRRRAAGEVEDELGHRRADGRRVEHVEVGDEAFPQQAAVGEAEHARGLEREHADGFLQREVLPVAHEVSEQVRLDRRVRHLAHVCARVGEAHHRVRVSQAAQRPVVVEG